MSPSAISALEKERKELPTSGEFASIPATWYLFCLSRQLGEKPLSQTILGRRLVAFRGDSGRVTVLDATCAHLGADLGRGRVQGDTIQCPFHHWQYTANGRCVATSRGAAVTNCARLRVYPAQERHGQVFFFFGSTPHFPLPFFPNCDADDFVASRPFSFLMDCPWYMLVGNGFDTQHFHAVHDRKLTSEPRVDCPAEMARRMRFTAEVLGSSIFDRLLKRFAGEQVRVSITSWGGPYVLVEGQFDRAHSRLLVASRPLGENNTHSDVIVFARKSKRKSWDALNLRVRRRFTRAFLQYDIDKLSGVRYQPEGITEQDWELVEFLRWLNRLPRSDYAEVER